MAMAPSWRCVAVLILTGLCVGCGGYVAPGGAADLHVLGADRAQQLAETDSDMLDAFSRKPLAAFPARIAVVRVQQSGYRSRTAHGFGVGAYSVVSTRDIETDAQFERVANLPLVGGLAPVGRLLLPTSLATDDELRDAAARLQCDMLLIYTLDTRFFVEDHARPLSVVTLGLSPSKQARVITTASALLLDTRSGYLYGVMEATHRESQLANAWTSQDAIDQSRRRCETQAFDLLVEEFTKAWPTVTAQHATPQAAK